MLARRSAARRPSAGASASPAAPLLRVLLVHGLLRDAELVGDLLPRVPAFASLAHVDALHALEQPAERSDRPKPGVRVSRRDLSSQVPYLLHVPSTLVDGVRHRQAGFTGAGGVVRPRRPARSAAVVAGAAVTARRAAIAHLASF